MKLSKTIEDISICCTFAAIASMATVFLGDVISPMFAVVGAISAIASIIAQKSEFSQKERHRARIMEGIYGRMSPRKTQLTLNKH